jgi:hypothetical protein
VIVGEEARRRGKRKADDFALAAAARTIKRSQELLGI